MENKGCNGYTNWETWVTMLYLEEEFTQLISEHIDKITKCGELIDLYPSINESAVILEDYFWDCAIDITPWIGLAEEFIRMCAHQIKFREIAKHIMDEL